MPPRMRDCRSSGCARSTRGDGRCGRRCTWEPLTHDLPKFIVGRDAEAAGRGVDVIACLVYVVSVVAANVAFSADDERLLFSGVPPGETKREIYSIRLDGSGITRLTTNGWDDVYPDGYKPQLW